MLPFVNASADPENEYLSDGITDELINALAKVEGLSVASRTSVFALKGLREDVRNLGAGSASPPCSRAPCGGPATGSGSRRSSPAWPTGGTLWSERYDRELDDVFAIQDEIARTIVTTLRSTLLRDLGDAPPVRYTANLNAYQLYLKGRYWWNRRTPGRDRRGDQVLRAGDRRGRRLRAGLHRAGRLLRAAARLPRRARCTRGWSARGRRRGARWSWTTPSPRRTRRSPG